MSVWRQNRHREYDTPRRRATRGLKRDIRWKRLRMIALRRDQFMCVLCQQDGRTEPASQVDHIQPRDRRPDLTYVLSNLQSMCQSCHSKKTAAEKA